MKKYVYSKGAEAVTVETDELGTINNFMITLITLERFHRVGINVKDTMN